MRITVEANFHRPSRRKRTLLALVLMLALPGVVLASDVFSDVPDSSPYHDSISAIAEAGITVGCGSDSFCPDDPITREQEATFVHRAVGRVAQFYTETPIGVGGVDAKKAVGTVTILVPGTNGLGIGANQFVKVEGSVTIYGNGATSGCTCNLVMTIVDNDTGNEVADAFDEIRAVSGAQMAISTAYVFPESPGSHSYTLNVNISATADFNVNWRSLIATTYTFGGNGTDALGGVAPVSDGKNSGTQAAGQ